MKTLLRFVLLLVLTVSANAATTFTEFYCNPAGDNLNSGSSQSLAATATYAGGTFVRATGVFTVASGNPITDLTLPAWVSIYTTAGATTNTFTALITGTNATTITVSLTAMAGLVTSVSESAAAATCKVGGAWAGPNAAVSFPFNYVTAVMTNTSAIAIGYAPRVNFTNATYTVTAGLTNAQSGPIRWQGYGATPGDMAGKATFTETSGSGTSYIMLISSGANNDYADSIFSTSFTGGSSVGVSIQAASTVSRCVSHDIRGAGFSVIGDGGSLIECEAYNCDKTGSTSSAGFLITSHGCTLLRCISHDNATANAIGFYILTRSVLINCIADSNASHGFYLASGGASQSLISCDAYKNGGSGVFDAGSGNHFISMQNCNLVLNTLWGINLAGGVGNRNGSIVNCGFGSGTKANGSGTVSPIGSVSEIGSVTYASNLTPWVDPDNGDFRINLGAAINAGRGSFTETQASYSGTRSYPVIGAAQNQSGGAFPFSQ
jgi:hypothetical protein